MTMVKTWEYKANGVIHRTERALRKAVWEEDRLALPPCKTAEEWAQYKVAYIEADIQPTLTDLKHRKRLELEQRFTEYRQSSDTYIVSSLGFKANANETAFGNITGLIAQLEMSDNKEEATVSFMTFDNELKTLTLEEVKKLQAEVANNGSYVYAQKWTIRQAIENAVDKDELSNIDITFASKDFF